jgi:hypothetical protein
MGKRMLAMVAFALALTVMGNLTGTAQSHPVEGAYDDGEQQILAS